MVNSKWQEASDDARNLFAETLTPSPALQETCVWAKTVTSKRSGEIHNEQAERERIIQLFGYLRRAIWQFRRGDRLVVHRVPSCRSTLLGAYTAGTLASRHHESSL